MGCVGENLKVLREKSGFNQANIASFLEVDQSLISKIEKGERNISSDMLEKLACLFGVSVEDIDGEDFDCAKLSFAFRASDLKTSDLETICAINRIALNTEFMGRLVK